MSEEKKNIELNDKELEKVNGGFEAESVTLTKYSFAAGDCFACDARRVRVVYSYNNVYSNQTIIAEISENYTKFQETYMSLKDPIFREEFFVGNNVF